MLSRRDYIDKILDHYDHLRNKRGLVPRANSMSTAMRSRRTPPAIENAGTVIPRELSSVRPPAANESSTIVATTIARLMTRARSAGRMPGVRARNNGAMPTGSTTLTIVASDARKNATL
jgi:hypothetical protein